MCFKRKESKGRKRLSNVRLINNQEGSLMFVVLLIMAALAVAGLMATEDTVIENQIARNHAINKQNLYLAEGAAKQAAQALDLYDGIGDYSNLMGQAGAPLWINRTGTDTTFFNDTANWNSGGNAQASQTDGNTPGVNSNALYAVDFVPSVLISGDDEDVDYSVYGWSFSTLNNDNAEILLEIGFRKRVRVP